MALQTQYTTSWYFWLDTITGRYIELPKRSSDLLASHCGHPLLAFFCLIPGGLTMPFPPAISMKWDWSRLPWKHFRMLGNVDFHLHFSFLSVETMLLGKNPHHMALCQCQGREAAMQSKPDSSSCHFHFIPVWVQHKWFKIISKFWGFHQGVLICG